MNKETRNAVAAAVRARLRLGLDPTRLRVGKLLYYASGYASAMGIPASETEIVFWPYGPNVPALYTDRMLNTFGPDPVGEWLELTETDPADPRFEGVLEKVAEAALELSDIALIKRSMAEAERAGYRKGDTVSPRVMGALLAREYPLGLL